MSGGFRASAIPSNVRKIIQDIKDITGRHSDDEIYAMLKECYMDPNEATQKLLLQDTFHEVKRRKDRKKESQPHRETTDLKWRSSLPGRGARGSYASRYAAPDAGVGRNTVSCKENGVSQTSEKVGVMSSPTVAQEAKSKDAGSPVGVMTNGPIGVVSGSTKSAQTSEVQSESVIEQFGMTSLRQSHIVAGKRYNMASSGRDARGKLGGKSYGAGKNQAAEVSQPSLLTPGSSSSSRPSSNYGSRTQQGVGFQKVGPNKEWKPKPTNANSIQEHSSLAASDGAVFSAEAVVHTQPVQSTTDSEETVNKLQMDLENLHVRDAQHVIIPNHIHVPEAVRTGLSFGSFDSAFVIRSSCPSELDNQNNSKPNSETHQGNEAAVEEPATSNPTPAVNADYADNAQSTKEAPENVSPNDVVASSSVPHSSESEKDTADTLQLSSVHTTAGYNFGLMPVPAAVNSPLGAIEASETQTRDASRVPGFVVQQPVDPSSFYAQIYRSGVDNDGRISPFPGPGVAANYNGNLAILSAQTSQSTPEGGNSMVLSTTAQTPLATQATGMMPSCVAVTQQPMPLFRQPPGVHLPHYPPNFIPYGHYFSPFYVPPPAMHRFIGNSAFPQQPQAGSVYPGQPAVAAAATAVKYPLSQYKPGSNSGNSHMGVGGGYNQYVAPSAGFNPGPVSTAGNPTANEDLAASQFKESNMYITGQQTEGSAVWIPAAGRDISSLPVNSFYNLSPQGQHVSFGPAQAGQGSFAGIYHPAQAVTAATLHPLLQQSQAMPGAVDMVGATASIYQQPQHAQMNWPNNY